MLYIYIWVMLYGGIHIISNLISQILHVGQRGIAIAMLLYVCFFVAWICANGRNSEIGLCITNPFGQMKSLHMIFLFVLPIFNIICEKDIKITFWAIVYMICISMVEEIFFRGFLLRYLLKRSKLYGIIISSVIFAGFHVVNLFQHKYSIYILLQVLCAFVAGICYSAVSVRYNSIFPSFMAHSFTNITGVGSLSHTGFIDNLYGLCICVAIYTAYGVFLCRKINDDN